MTLQEIKSAINEGFKVYWKNQLYEVIKDSIGQYLIYCHSNGHCIGLTWRDNETMNGDKKDFFKLDAVCKHNNTRFLDCSDCRSKGIQCNVIICSECGETLN